VQEIIQLNLDEEELTPAQQRRITSEVTRIGEEHLAAQLALELKRVVGLLEDKTKNTK
jgi:hypothetical protein